MITRYTTLAILMVGLLLSGCSQQTVTSAKQDMSKDIQTANQAADKEVAKARPALDKLNLGVRVTTALRANANLPDTIRVDANTNGVRLRGSVQNAKQKSLAGKIAQQTLPPGKSVQNQLAVSKPGA